MLDIGKMLSGLFQGGEKPIDKLKALNNPGMTPTQTPGINPMAQAPNPGQAPDIIPTGQMPQMMPEKAGIDWKARMLGGLKGFQTAQQSQASVAPQMDTTALNQMQFAHKQNAGIIPRGRY